MFGPFRPSMPALGGLLWKNRYSMSKFQKARHRKRLQAVDTNIDVLWEGLVASGKSCKAIEELRATLPRESEMEPRDKYWVFSRTGRNYRKSAHKQLKWTRITNRVPPQGF